MPETTNILIPLTVAKDAEDFAAILFKALEFPALSGLPTVSELKNASPSDMAQLAESHGFVFSREANHGQKLVHKTVPYLWVLVGASPSPHSRGPANWAAAYRGMFTVVDRAFRTFWEAKFFLLDGPNKQESLQRYAKDTPLPTYVQRFLPLMVQMQGKTWTTKTTDGIPIPDAEGMKQMKFQVRRTGSDEVAQVRTRDDVLQVTVADLAAKASSMLDWLEVTWKLKLRPAMEHLQLSTGEYDTLYREVRIRRGIIAGKDARFRAYPIDRLHAAFNKLQKIYQDTKVEHEAAAVKRQEERAKERAANEEAAKKTAAQPSRQDTAPPTTPASPVLSLDHAVAWIQDAKTKLEAECGRCQTMLAEMKASEAAQRQELEEVRAENAALKTQLQQAETASPMTEELRGFFDFIHEVCTNFPLRPSVEFVERIENALLAATVSMHYLPGDGKPEDPETTKHEEEPA